MDTMERMNEKKEIDFHKERCKALKKVRKKMADAIGVDLHQRECTYQGKCSGTCPKCKQEEDILNKALLGRAGMAAGVVALSAGLAGCNPFNNVNNQIAGDMDVPVEVEYDGGLEEIDPDEATTAYNKFELEGDAELVDDPDDNLDSNSQDSTCSSTEEDGSEEIYELEGDVAAPIEE